MLDHIFVYGTLRMGHSAHDLVDKIADYVGDVTSMPQFEMIASDIPRLGGEEAIEGELYKLHPDASLDELDWYYGNDYERVQRWCVSEKVHAYLYIYVGGEL